MRKTIASLALLFATIPSVSVGMEASECAKRMESVDERIASGKYSAKNVATAKQMRESIMQSCAFLTEATLAPMMEGFEQLLPTRTEEERLAYEQERRSQRKKELEESREARAAQKAERARIEQERAERQEREKLPVSPVLLQPPTGTPMTVQLIDRPDNMHMVEIVDLDYDGELARILYRSYPSQKQEGSPSAAVHFYVLLEELDGTFSQHEVTRFPFDGLVRGGLRRGHAEAVFQRPGALSPTPEATLERRSLPDGDLVSSADLPDLGWTELSWGDSLFFRGMLDDGNLLYIGHPNAFAAYNSDAARAGNTLAWATVSPEGKIVRKGSYSSERANTLLYDWTSLPDNNLAFLVNVVLADHSAAGIATDLATPIVEAIEGAELRGFVAKEMRLLSFDSSTGVATASAGFDRFFNWQGQEATYRSDSISDVEEASKRMTTVAISNGAFENTSSSLERIGDQAGLLIDKKRGMDNAKTHGLWLREYAGSELVKQTHLESAAEHLDIKFSIVASAGQNAVYVYGMSSVSKRAYVIRLNRDREITAYSAAAVDKNGPPIAVLADKSGVQILSQQRDSRNRQVLGLERVRFAN